MLPVIVALQCVMLGSECRLGRTVNMLHCTVLATRYAHFTKHKVWSEGTVAHKMESKAHRLLHHC